jgi:hypothetical protein
VLLAGLADDDAELLRVAHWRRVGGPLVSGCHSRLSHQEGRSTQKRATSRARVAAGRTERRREAARSVREQLSVANGAALYPVNTAVGMTAAAAGQASVVGSKVMVT